MCEWLDFSSLSSTGSGQNQPSILSQGQEAGSFQNQPPKKSRKHNIASLLADMTNQPESCNRRLCKEETVSMVFTVMVREFEPRGDTVKGGKARWKDGQVNQMILIHYIAYIPKIDNFLTKGKSILAILCLRMCLGRCRKLLRFK